jgi:signal transduction histidine kinase
MCGGSNNGNIWVSYNRKDSLFIYDLESNKEIFITERYNTKLPKEYQVQIYKVEIKDINRDGRQEIIASVNGAYQRPRGIFVLDRITGKLLWKFLCGPVLFSFLVRDIDIDGNSEILSGTFAVNNRIVEKETDDFHTYVILLDSDGKPRWIKQIGVYSSEVKVSWLETPHSNSLKVIACETGNPIEKLRNCDSIFILDVKDGHVLEKAQYGNFNGDFTLIYNKKKVPLIAIGGVDDTLRILDENLKLVRKCAMNSMGCITICAGTFSGDNEPELAVATTGGQIQLYSLKLKMLAQLKNAGEIMRGCYFCSVKLLNKSRLLYKARINHIWAWHLIEFNQLPLLNRGVPIASVLVGAIGFFLLFAIAMVYARYTKTRDIRTVIKGLTGKSGVIELNRKGDIVTISPRAREILKIEDKDRNQTLKTLLENKQVHPVIELAKSMITDIKLPSPQETAISISQEQSYLVRCIRVKNGVLITFEDISAVEYMKRITSWAPVAQKLAHGIKTPLMNIQLSAQQLESSCEPVKDKTEKIIDSIKSEATRLRKLTDNFMRFTQFAQLNLSLENINDILKDLCNKYSFTIPERIKINCELSNESLNVMVDRKEIETAISIIIDNAVEAMNLAKEQKQEVLGIRTFIAERQEKEISDTGKGIPEKYLSELFKPYFTYGKPEGTGLGLTLAKKIIESHNGSIEIQSKEGIGTTVSIFLPI